MKRVWQVVGLAVGIGACMTACAAEPGPAAAQDIPHRVVYEGSAGPGAGRHIVLIAGDHEYRSEEILPALARILARRYGFRCTVLFTLDEQGFIEPGSSRIAGLDALETADLMILALRFQDLPAPEMQHIVNYLDRGGPVMGLRTATHAFRIADGPFAKYSWDYAGEAYAKGFGRQVLGETWVGHWGTNHEQSTRFLAVEAEAGHPILRGVRDVHVVSGGYEAYPIEGSTVLAMGQVLDGMAADAPPDPDRALMPVAWTRAYESASGRRPRVFTTTHGASEDLLNDGFRRMLVNAALWAVGLEAAIDAASDIAFVGPYHPTRFSFDGYRRGVRPSDLAGWDSPIMSPDRPTRVEPVGSSGGGNGR